MSTNQNNFNKHSYFMNLALQQAYKNLGNTKQNPSVGCVIIKNNHVISAGFTSVAGRPHAEHNAITLSKVSVTNSDIYVTLEPCSNYGKTSPCVKKIINKKIKRVFFSIKDPDPRSYNMSIKQFKKRNIVAKEGIINSEVRNFYTSYYKQKKNILPFVAAKIAVSKDMYTKNKKKKWITNKFSRGRVHLMRSNHDCIITGINTVLSDNPKLTCRIEGLESKSPSRVILDKNLRISTNSNIVKDANKYQTIIYYNKDNKRKLKVLKHHKVKLIKINLDKNKKFNLKEILINIKSLGFYRIFIESGLNLTTSFLSKNLVDFMYIYMSNKNLGKNGENSFKKNIKLFLNKNQYTEEKVNLHGDRLFSCRLK